MVRRFLGILLLAVVLAPNAYAAKKTAKTPAPPPIPVESAQLQKCLKRADDLPDMAAAEAAAWIKKGGGNEAHLCRAFAQANRGMHEDAAREFWYIASYYDKHDAKHAISMHDLSGQEFLHAKDPKNAVDQFTASLKIAPANRASLIGRAESLMELEKFWDALADLNRALKINPEDADVLRQRGRAWLELGNDKNAQEDFGHAAALSSPPDDKTTDKTTGKPPQ